MKQLISFSKKQPRGFVLLSILLTTAFVMVAGIATAQLATSNYHASVVEQYRVNTQFTADAGIDSAMREINLDSNWAGTNGSEVTLYNTSAFKTTYKSVVTNDTDPYKKYITVTARAYVPASSPTPRIERVYQVAIRAVTAGDFSVVTGVGGLTLTNNAKIIGGNVYVNGTIDMTNSATIGLSTDPVEVKVAHQSCPVSGGASYPRVCNSGEDGQPISLSGTAHIYGQVTATNQTSGAGMSQTGLTSGTVAPAALPSHDRAAQVAAVTTTQNASAASCSSGTKTWAANTKFTGNVSVSNSCQVTVQGNVWITGSFNISNSAKLIVANGLSTPPVIMIDAQNGFNASNAAKLVNNSSGIGFIVITYWSNSSCSPDCADVTGTNLLNSTNTSTIQLSNNADGPGTEFYARWSQVQLSNGGNIGALVGQRVKLTNSAAVTFGTTVSGVGGISGWVIDSYKRNS